MKGWVDILTNTDFYRRFEASVRENMKKAETEVLPTAKQAIKDARIKPADCPIEGYYYETPELTEYFKIIRALQNSDNYNSTITESIRKLHDFYSSDALGFEQAYPTAINPKARYTDEKPVIISGRIEQITIAVEKLTNKLPLEIIKKILNKKNVCDNLFEMPLHKNLGGLALLIDKIEHEKQKDTYEPFCATLSAETTSLSRALAPAAGCAPPERGDFQVSPEVVRQAKIVGYAYNKLFKNSGIKTEIAWEYSNFWDAELPVYNDFLPPTIRCARLFSWDKQEPHEHYHWITQEYNTKVEEKWAPNIITTQELLNQKYSHFY